MAARRYEFRETLGSGGNGRIALVHDVNRNIDVIFKVEKAGPSANREKEVLQRFAPSRYCPTYYGGFNYNNGQEFRSITILERLWRDLWDVRVMCGGRLSLSTSTRLILEGLDAIQELHTAGFIHGDIKPSNFMIGSDNKLYLIDYGMAQPFRDNLGHTISVGSAGFFCSTVRYASPNAHNHTQPLSPRDDIWSLLFTYFELLHGELPWERFEKDERLTGVEKIRYLSSNAFKDALPGSLEGFVNHVSNLAFNEMPDYKYLKRCLRDVLRESWLGNETFLFDWEMVNRSSLFYWPLP